MEAATIFRGAEEMNGFEAWRRLVRYVEHGRPIRLQNITNEMKSSHSRPIKDMARVVIGIAEYENKYHDYLDAGGKPYDDYDLKNNLTNILPASLQEPLLFNVNLPENILWSVKRSGLQLCHCFNFKVGYPSTWSIPLKILTLHK